MGDKGGGKAMCNIPSESHSWQKLSDEASTFMCAKVVNETDVKHFVKGSTFEAVLAPRESLTTKFKFQFRKLTVYEVIHLHVECKKYSVLPVIDLANAFKKD